MHSPQHLALLLALGLACAACGDDGAAPEVQDGADAAAQAGADPASPSQGGTSPSPAGSEAPATASGTPMEERVATLGLLNKRNNVAQDIAIKPGESKQLGNVIIRLSACERTPPWEMPEETGAFVQLDIVDPQEEETNRVFSGWLFKNSPSINVVEHPVYDVWVKSCAMRFPGESAPSDESDS